MSSKAAKPAASIKKKAATPKKKAAKPSAAKEAVVEQATASPVPQPAAPAPAPAYISTETKLRRDQVEKAVAALCKHEAAVRAKKATEGRNKSLTPSDGDDFVFLLVSLCKVPLRSLTRPANIPLPHSLREGANTDVCLFVKSKKVKEALKQQVAEQGLSTRLKIIEVKKLKTDYTQYEARRKLAGSYDVFLVDKRIYPLMPGLLGKTFFVKNKMPIVVQLGGKKKSIKEVVEGSISSAHFRMRRGSAVTLKVAKLSFDEAYISDNILAATDGVTKIIEGGMNNIKSLLIKSSRSVALPVYCKPVATPRTIPTLEGEEGKEKQQQKKSEKSAKSAKAEKKGAMEVDGEESQESS